MAALHVGERVYAEDLGISLGFLPEAEVTFIYISPEAVIINLQGNLIILQLNWLQNQITGFVRCRHVIFTVVAMAEEGLVGKGEGKRNWFHTCRAIQALVRD